jgi:acyl-CoA thioesterase-2
VPLLQDWALQLPGDLARYGRHWIEQPPPVEMRLPQAPSFLGGSLAGRTRSHWMRAPRDVGASPLLHAALLAYASDFFLMDMVFHAHPGADGPGRCNGLSLDHAIWFHRPVKFDQWHLHTQETVAIAGDRGLARGVIHDAEGRLTATVMQEVLVLPVAAR